MSNDRYLGLISGTSRDGLDAVVVEFEDDLPTLFNARCVPYPEGLRHSIDELIQLGRAPSALEARQVDRNLGHFFARVSNDLIRDSGLENRDIKAIGSHGQTVWHDPQAREPVSLQLGSGFVMANITQLPVVVDFRSADVLAGGEGAPLAPLLHRKLFAAHNDANPAGVAVLNLGGIANLTLFRPDGTVSGHDTGTANCLMDLWNQRHQGTPYDEDGQWAASGTLLPDLLEQFLSEPYFSAPAPKSTGLELFNQGWLEKHLHGTAAAAQPKDVQHTLLMLTVETIARDLETSAPGATVAICGGGVHNSTLLAQLQARLPEHRLRSSKEFGVHPDWVEAILFAWLAREHLLGREQDTPPITGARHPVLLGNLNMP